MNNSQKYKLGTIEIVAFIIGVFVLMGLNKYIFRLSLFDLELSRFEVQIAVVSFFSTLFGSITGGLTGFLGIICSFAVCGRNVGFPPAIGYAIYGAMLGQFADRYFIREGKFGLKQICLWNCVNFFSLITAFILAKPMVEFVFYNTDMIANLRFCFRLVFFAIIPTGIILTALLILVSCLNGYVKKESLG